MGAWRFRSHGWGESRMANSDFKTTRCRRPKPLGLFSLFAIHPSPFTRRLAVAATVFVAVASAGSMAGPVIPTDGMIITQDTTFEPGVYVLPNGVSIGASGVTLNLNGARLTGVEFDHY